MPLGKELWIIKEPHKGSYHPDSGPLIVKKDGKFFGTAAIGNSTLGADSGEKFTVHIIMASY